MPCAVFVIVEGSKPEGRELQNMIAFRGRTNEINLTSANYYAHQMEQNCVC